ncbi:D123-domain-containing protein [Metschnikowia bicuspidata var. bicuspidata NRRL YB-4993]|uniref:D123-domain-containing protein n=1 Tax=Metschnikowia bicuspidata var. bicuspidata NRRL YB-4993 TaxID=869754 RepID=A0A1A0HJW5_9ASCO|nr:D123-domain-containing protein [Metschnikowia bicuspidata var. bicuspidata NRRL YB-4993]OBA24177.1 D123-domain-containing protein [Metschnikowia bicuspidata var. bicuspidata NRRL YB-4993]
MTKLAFTFNDLPVTCAQVNECSYSSWSPHFASHIPEARILSDIPDAFLEYLNSDSIRLPPARYDDYVTANSDNEYSDWEDDIQESGASTAQAENPCAGFADFDKKIQEVVGKWRHVMPKLNWSAPKDARWILINNSLQCTSNADIYLLLNASDHIAHDLDGHIYDDCEDKDGGPRIKPEIVLKKWSRDWNPALEFRIFVKNRRILGVSQRDMNHYQFLQELHPKLVDLLERFQTQVIRKSAFPLKDYIMDVYVPAPHEKISIVDINPFARKWDSLLFTWHELLEKDNDGVFELRLITETNLGAMARKEHSENQVPIEVVDALMNTEAMVELAKTWGIKDA